MLEYHSRLKYGLSLIPGWAIGFWLPQVLVNLRLEYRYTRIKVYICNTERFMLYDYEQKISGRYTEL